MSEALVLYAIPVVFLIALWLLISLVIYVLVRSPLEFDFKQDLLVKFEGKRRLRSGRDRLSFFFVARLLLGDNCIQAALLYRVSRWLRTHRLRPLSELAYAFSKFLTHTDLSPGASIGPGLYLYHGLGTVIGKNAQVGARALICHGVSIGGGTTIGADVKVWAGAQILARVRIGDRTEVGANAVVMADFPSDSILFGVPARLAGKTSAEPQTASQAATSAG